MTEFEYDCYRKKNIAHSAMRRKGGSKSKKCPLSTDYMTKKQWNERCGKVMSYQIGKPMLWAEFCKLPKDLKEEYLNNLIDKYSANAKSCAEMFGVSAQTVFRHIKSENLNVEFLKGRYPRGEKEQAFKLFLSGDSAESIESMEGPETDQPESEVAQTPEECAPENEGCEDMEENETNSKSGTRLDSFTMNFSGEVNVDMIANSLRYILAGGGRAKIQIICELE